MSRVNNDYYAESVTISNMQTIPKYKFSTTIPIDKQKVFDFFSTYIEYQIENAVWETYVCKDGSLLVLRPNNNEGSVWVYFHLNITVDQSRQSIGFIGINWMMNFCKEYHSEILNVRKKIVLPVSEGAVMSVIYTSIAFRIAQHYACNPKDRQEKGKKKNT